MKNKTKYSILFATYRLRAVVLSTAMGFGLAFGAAVAETGREPGSRTENPMKKNESNSETRRQGAMPHRGRGEGRHRHSKWVKPPKPYLQSRGERWADLNAVLRGQKIFTKYCAMCHGTDGRGSGPMAKELLHKPADLTRHFHKRPGIGDAYLFWRVSEGGTVEPFVSMQSAMPAFKELLTANERWDVLAYVHTYFHLGLVNWRKDSTGKDLNKKRQHRHQGHHKE